MKHLLISLILTTPFNVNAYEMIDYTTIQDEETYIFVDGHGADRSENRVYREKRFDWMVAPDNQGGEWYRTVTTYFNSQSECDPDILNRQVAHQYISSSVWELAGQTQTECNQHKVNVYADENLKPIIIAPGAAESTVVYKSDLWIEWNPYWHTPDGYPHSDANHLDLSYSYSKFINHFDSYTLSIEGQGSVTYNDVIKVFWRHGAAADNNAPCGDVTPGRYRVDGYRTMGRIRWYAKDVGLIKQVLQWRCWKGKPVGTWSPDADHKRFTEYRKWW